MKRFRSKRSSILFGALGAVMLCSCTGDAEVFPVPDSASAPVPISSETNSVTETPPLEEHKKTSYLRCRIVDGAEEQSLLLADLDSGEVYLMELSDSIVIELDGAVADPKDLQDGMNIEVAYHGDVMETFPARLSEVDSILAWPLGSQENPAGTTFDLCGLYLQVLDDLWNTDLGLNEDISVAGLDLSRAPGDLSEGEKSAIAYQFGRSHGVEVVTGTFDELVEQGYIQPLGEERPELCGWEDGCFFSISSNERHQDQFYSLSTIFFDAEKWASPLGAYCFYDCMAGWPEMGSWSSYQIGDEMIS